MNFGSMIFTSIARCFHTSVVLADDVILVMGGAQGIGSIAAPFNDVWKSTDKGFTWGLVTAKAGWNRKYCVCS
jgi:hypothetical protein